MAKKQQKFYVVWYGHRTGIFPTWDDCKAAINGVKGAQYKSFLTFQEAKIAYDKEYADYKGKNTKKKVLTKEEIEKIGEPNLYTISVDAASSGNPGKMEYRGVDTQTMNNYFIKDPFFKEQIMLVNF